MPVVNCKQCGKIFRKVTSDICPKCQKEEEELLSQAREYLRENPQAMIYDFVEDLEIEQSLLERWVEEGRLVLIKDPEAEASKPKCSSCGREVKEGQTYCRTCMFKKLQSKGPQKAGPEKAAEQPKPQSHGMHYKKD
ncbi:MAG: hypothetical protein ABIH23_11635 [bacterium]